MIKPLLLAVLPVLPIAVGAAQPDSAAASAACRAITSDAERLACYDRLAAPVRAASPDEAPAQPVVTVPPTSALPAPVDQPAAAAAGTASSFGAEAVPKPKTAEPKTLAATVVGVVDGVRRDQILLLDNGQRWRVLSDNDFDYTAEGPAARIERNLIGTYWMRLGDRGPSFKVRRVQ